MRTITKNQLLRLEAQSEEAKTLGLKKISTHLDEQIEKHTYYTRDDSEFYSYSFDQIQADVEKNLWNAVMRVSDYYGKNIDAVKAQESIESLASELINEIRLNAGVKDGVGAYEPNVPGENREHVSIELEE